MSVEILVGDCRDVLKTMPEKSVQCVVTSPPYFGLRDYNVDGQIGLESTVDAYVAELVAVFREVRRVLADDGTCWVNLGDSYAAARGGTHQPAETLAGGKGGYTASGDKVNRSRHDGYNPTRNATAIGLKHKDLIGIPWRVAFALQADGWYLRSDIIWSKPNPMPESVRDRPTKAHEYLFMFSKSARYFYDADAIAEPTTWDPNASKMPDGWDTGPGGHGSFHRNGREKGVSARDNFRRENSKRAIAHPGQTMGTHRPDRKDTEPTGYRNKRSVWTIATKGYKGAHFATFPPALVEPCILAGSRPGDIVLDPFGGSGTTAQVAIQHGRHAILIELNPEYVPLIEQRIATPIKPARKPKKQVATTPHTGQMELFSHEL